MFGPSDSRSHLAVGVYLAKWLAIAALVGTVVGSAVALFLWSLERATELRWAHPWLLFGLPLAGLGIGLMYRIFGRKVESGNNLILEQIHEPNGGVPTRMAPLVLIGTVVTHLCGGSAGREGTAVQMGGSLAYGMGRWLRLPHVDSRGLLMAGVAAGFGAVFGTPLAGAVFAMEVLAIGRISYDSLLPCLAASIIGDATVRAWGIGHTHYYIGSLLSSVDLTAQAPLSGSLMAKVMLAAIVFGLASALFAEITHAVQRLFAFVAWPPMRPVLGGLVVIGMVYAVGTRDYLGLGTNADPATPNAVTIQSCFTAGGATPWSWWWKIAFTAVTLGSGFKGGEVTPLFFIGAALGNTLARLQGAPVDLLAGLGFVAVFAGATNTPLACTIMGFELFVPHSPGLLNSGFGIYLPVACFLAYFVSGHSGIYTSQRIGTPKVDEPHLLPEMSLRLARELGRAPRNRPFVPARSASKVSTFSSNGQKGELMSDSSSVDAQEIGQLRIFLTPRERRKKGFGGLFGKPLYQEIIQAAKQEGVMNAVAHRMHFGYSNHGKLEHNNHELPNPALTLCVELIGGRQQLHGFCQQHAELLQGKVAVFEKLERWVVSALDTAAGPPKIDDPEPAAV